MIVSDLKKSILHVAIRGELTKHINSNKYFYKEQIKEFSNSGIRIKREESLNELKYSLPSNWRWVRLEEVASIYGRIGFRGYTTQDLVSEGDGAITLSPSNIVDAKMDYSSCTYISWEKYEESPEIKIKNDDILLVKTGSSYGKNAIVKDLPQEATINPQFAVIKNIICNITYLFYVLNSDLAKQQYERFVIGTSIPTFSQAKLNSLLIPLPPIEEQELIVERIEELYAKLDDIKVLEDELESIKRNFPLDMRKSILFSAISGGLSECDTNDTPVENQLKKIFEQQKVYSNDNNIKVTNRKEHNYKYFTDDKYSLPETWKYVPLSEVCVVIFSGKSPIYSKEENTNYIIGQKVNQEDGLHFEDVKYGDNKYFQSIPEYQFLKNNDILLNTLGGGSVGRTGIFNSKERASTDGHIFVIRTNKLTNEKYIMYFLRLYREKLEEYANGSTNQKFFNIKQIEDLMIPLPPIEEQQRIVDMIEQLLPLCSDIEKLVNS